MREGAERLGEDKAQGDLNDVWKHLIEGCKKTKPSSSVVSTGRM